MMVADIQERTGLPAWILTSEVEQLEERIGSFLAQSRRGPQSGQPAHLFMVAVDQPLPALAKQAVRFLQRSRQLLFYPLKLCNGPVITNKLTAASLLYSSPLSDLEPQKDPVGSVGPTFCPAICHVFQEPFLPASTHSHILPPAWIRLTCSLILSRSCLKASQG